jgi:formylmethanofuran dehydrogenase subunit E
METKQQRAQPLKVCDKCGKDTERQGGVLMKNKWICGACWIKWSNSK